jgi:tetratricopeptide (TPR) repeat protein
MNPFLSRAGVAGLALFLGACQGPDTVEDPAADFTRVGGSLEEADAAFYAENYSRAVPLYEEALQQRPAASTGAYLRLADCHEALGHPETACLWLERGRDRTGGNAALFRRLALRYEQNGRIVPALESAEAALLRAPRDPEAQRDAGRLRAAFLAALRTTLDVSAPPPGGGSIGVAETLSQLDRFLSEGQPADAVSVYESVLAPLPELALQLRAGELFAGRRREAEAAAAYRRALELDPFCAEAYVHLGDLSREKQQPDEAASWYRRGLDASPGDERLKARLAAVTGPAPH